MAKKRALFVLGGTMKGAYIVGIMRVFYEELGPLFFDSIYSRSVGIFEQAFFASNQPETMERTWREYVHGSQLINFGNIFYRKPILDLDYLVELFQNEKSLLNVDQMNNSPINLFSFATDTKTKSPVMFNLKEGDIFETMKATCALPILYHPVSMGNYNYLDGAWADQDKWSKFIEKIYGEYDEIVVVLNKNTDKKYIPYSSKLKLLKPSRMPLWHPFDTNRKRIIETIEQGKGDALEFLKTYSR